MSTSTIPAVRAALKTAIVTQLTSDGTTGVSCFAYPPGDQATQTDSVILDSVSGEQTHLTFGGSRTETFELTGYVWVMNPGAGDTVAATVETRAFTILASVENTVRAAPTLSSQAWHAQFAGYESDVGANVDGRWCRVTFRVAVESHL